MPLRSENRNCRRPSLPPLGLDELEGRVAEVVHERGFDVCPVALEAAHLRDHVGDRGIADRHEVHRPPDARHVIRQAFSDPQGHRFADERLRHDVEFEDVRQLVDDQPVEEVRRIVEREQHPSRYGSANAPTPSWAAPGMTFCCSNSLCVLKMIRGHLEREVVLQLGADLLVGALGVARHRSRCCSIEG